MLCYCEIKFDVTIHDQYAKIKTIVRSIGERNRRKSIPEDFASLRPLLIVFYLQIFEKYRNPDISETEHTRMVTQVRGCRNYRFICQKYTASGTNRCANGDDQFEGSYYFE